MAIHRQTKPQTKIKTDQDNITVSLKKIAYTSAGTTDKTSSDNEIKAYSQDIKRSLAVGAGAVFLELIIYFFKII